LLSGPPSTWLINVTRAGHAGSAAATRCGAQTADDWCYDVVSGMTPEDEAIRKAYDAVADAYAQRFADELSHKALDRALLGAFVEQLPSRGGLIGDVGCGPGHVARYLKSLGFRSTGVDLSPAMVKIARRSDPTIEFTVASMLALPAGDREWEGIVALYSIIHLEPTQVQAAIAEFFRVLTNRGLLMVAIHVGNQVRHVDELLGQAVSLDFRFMEISDLETKLGNAGFEVMMTMERSPYEPYEAPTRRGYVLARKP
jgi:ubiquinone/menaquinone biosynthesis C-methylase UbiE